MPRVRCALAKMLAHDEPPGYRQRQPRKKPKLAPFLPIIEQILRDDRSAPKKQRHTAWRIFQRLKDEHGFTGGYTVVKDAVRDWRQSHQEVFLPLSHPPGEAQVDFGEATIRLAGMETKAALFVMTLPCSVVCSSAWQAAEFTARCSCKRFPANARRPFWKGIAGGRGMSNGCPKDFNYHCYY